MGKYKTKSRLFEKKNLDFVVLDFAKFLPVRILENKFRVVK